METDELSERLRVATTTGEQLRVLRQRAGSTLRDLARHAAIDAAYLWRVENNLVLPPTGETWTRYERALLAPLTGTDHETARRVLSAIRETLSTTVLSQAAVNQTLRAYPALKSLLFFTAAVGLSEEEQGEVGKAVIAQSKRFLAMSPRPQEVPGHRKIQRERRSSAKAKEQGV